MADGPSRLDVSLHLDLGILCARGRGHLLETVVAEA